MNFFETIFPDLEETKKYICIWIKKKEIKKSYWLQNVFDASNLCSAPELSGHDIYFGLGLSDSNLGEHRRCKADEVAGIPGFWIDIDCINGAHEKKNLPSKSEALKIIEGVYKPSLTIDTVGGFHCYWLFNEILIFDNSEERQNAANLLNDFQNYLRINAKKHGWELDKTHDLSRVLRVPDTISTKYNKLVEVSEFLGERFNISDFEMFRTETPHVSTINTASSTFDYTLPPPADKLQILLVNDETFNKTWFHKRRMQDQSQSAYDMSLANIVSQTGWSDQEIVSLLIHNRQLYNPQTMTKHKSDDYYSRTIFHARQNIASKNNVLMAEAEASQLQNSEGFDALSKKIGVTIIKFFKFMSEPCSYAIVIENIAEPIQLGEARDLLNQNVFRTRIFESADILIKKIHNTKETNYWEIFIEALNDRREEIELGEETTERGETNLWLKMYLYDQGEPFLVDVDANNNSEGSIPRFAPIIDGNGIIWIVGNHLLNWLTDSRKNNITKRALFKRLRNVGCVQKRQTLGGDKFDIFGLPKEF